MNSSQTPKSAKIVYISLFLRIRTSDDVTLGDEQGRNINIAIKKILELTAGCVSAVYLQFLLLQLSWSATTFTINSNFVVRDSVRLNFYFFSEDGCDIVG